MSLKLSGKEFKEFLKADWGDPKAFWDDYCIKINDHEVDDYDEDKIEDGDKIEILGGDIHLRPERVVDAVAFAKQWLDKYMNVFIVAQVPRDQAELFKTHIAQFPGAKIV